MLLSLNKDILYSVIEKTIRHFDNAKLRGVSRTGRTCKKLHAIAQKIINKNTYTHNFYLLSVDRPDIIVMSPQKIYLPEHIGSDLWFHSIKTSQKSLLYLHKQDIYSSYMDSFIAKGMVTNAKAQTNDYYIDLTLKGYPPFEIEKYLLFNQKTNE
jgi:hypothetical protein